MRSLTTVAVLVLALAGAGCGGAGSGTTGTSAGSGPGPAGDSSSSAQGKAVRFAACVRGHGVADFPDPDARGEFRYGISVSPQVWRRATDACRSLQPPESLSTRRTPKQQSAGLRFARCVRAHGVDDFPDPEEGEPLINTLRIPSTDAPGGMDVLDAAIAACRSGLDAAAAGQ